MQKAQSDGSVPGPEHTLNRAFALCVPSQVAGLTSSNSGRKAAWLSAACAVTAAHLDPELSCESHSMRHSHHEIWKYYQISSSACAKGFQSA